MVKLFTDSFIILPFFMIFVNDFSRPFQNFSGRAMQAAKARANGPFKTFQKGEKDGGKGGGETASNRA